MSRLPHDTTKLFCEIWDNADDFKTDVMASGLHVSELDEQLPTIYYLLYARHANSAIANWDQNQFKYKVYSIIYQYGPTWAKRMEIQGTLRTLDEHDLITGSSTINAHAYAMGNTTVDAYSAPNNIDQKSSMFFNKSKLEGYSNLIDLLETDVTGEFLDRFKPLFAKFVYTKPDIYITELDEEEEED